MIKLIKLIAIANAVAALYILFPDFGLKYFWLNITILIRGPDRLQWMMYFPLTIFLNPIIPFLKLLASYGLFKLKPWAWRLAVGIFSIDFFFKFLGSINYVKQVIEFQNKPLPPIGEGTVVFTFSMWPVYIIGLISIISVFVLIQPSAKDIFRNSSGTNLAR